jgi:hypothetical protein
VKEMPNVGQELLNSPFPDVVLMLASAIAEGQYKLDLVSCEIARMMGDNAKKIKLPRYELDTSTDSLVDREFNTTLLGAGFQPTFYQFTDTIIELKMAITMTKETNMTISGGAGLKLGKIFAASVNASYSSKYTYKVEGSSLLRTNLKPVPTNSFLTEYLEQQALLQQAHFDKILNPPAPATPASTVTP